MTLEPRISSRRVSSILLFALSRQTRSPFLPMLSHNHTFTFLLSYLQTTVARAENEVLKAKVKELEGRCKVLAVENESLKAEVEMYRAEAAAANPSSSTSHNSNNLTTTTSELDTSDDFIKSGNRVYPSSPEAVLENLHGISNLLSCALSPDDTILATGGADQHLNLCQWGGALDGKDVASENSSRIDCGAPVICVGFAKLRVPFVAGGCMDGSVHLIQYNTSVGGGLEATKIDVEVKHSKYVKTLIWHETQNILATASADGSVFIHKLKWNSLNDEPASLERIETLQLSGPVEAMCFHDNHLCCYARGTPHLSLFDMDKDFAQMKINLNQGPGSSNYQDHVSFCVMRKYRHTACQTNK